MAVVAADVGGVFPPEMFCQLKLCQIGNKPDRLIIDLFVFIRSSRRPAIIYSRSPLLFRTILRFIKEFSLFSSSLWCSLWIVYEC